MFWVKAYFLLCGIGAGDCHVWWPSDHASRESSECSTAWTVDFVLCTQYTKRVKLELVAKVMKACLFSLCMRWGTNSVVLYSATCFVYLCALLTRGFIEKHGNLRFYWEAWKFKVLLRSMEIWGFGYWEAWKFEVLLSWARLGSVLGASWGVVGASWRRPRVFFRFSAALKPSWDRLGGVLEALGSALGASWRRLGGAWQRLGGVLEASWRFWSCLWSDITPIVDF